MARREHLRILRTGIRAWNSWRKENPDVRPDLRQAKLPKERLGRVNLKGVNLHGAYLYGAHLYRANLREADLTRANLTGANLSEAHLEGANLSEAHLEGANLPGAHLEGADLSMAHLDGANLQRAYLRDANLQLTRLCKADLEKAILCGANLRRANLQGAGLNEADLSGANLQGADLREIVFADWAGHSANLTGAILRHARLTGISEGTSATGFLELATASGLETVDFGDPNFLAQYITNAFDYAHQPDLREAREFPRLFEKALANIKLLRSLIQTQDEPPPPQFVEVVRTITAELIQYLRRHPRELYRLRPRQFEELIAEILASYGWDVQLTPPTKDGGYDIFAISKDIAGRSTSWLIECKKYSAENKVGVDIVRALYGANLLHANQADNLMLATTSHFTKGVHDYKASRYDLELRDYEGILEWINEYRPNPEGKLYIKDHQLMLPGNK